RATIDGQTFVDRTMSRRIRIGNYRDYWSASERRDCAVFTRKDKTRCTRSCTVVYDKAIAAIKDEARGISLLATCSGNRERRDNSPATHVVECCFAGSVVGDPPRGCWTRV